MPTYDFDNVDEAALRASPSSKWNRHDADVLPAWVADMDFRVAPPIDAAVRAIADSGLHLYPRSSTYDDVALAYAERSRSRWGVEADPELVFNVSEIVQAMHAATLAFSEPGDGVLIFTPVYPPFLAVPLDQRRVMIEHRMAARDHMYTFDFETLRAQVEATRPKVFLLCNPHNPVGRVFTHAELRALSELVIEFDMICVADEIHSDLVFEPHRHVVFASLGQDVASRTITLTSASKAFNLAGLRCAVMGFGSASLKERFESVVPEAILGKPSTAGMVATVAAWRECDDWLAACVAHLDGNRRYVVGEVARRLPGVRCIEPEGTYLAWLDFTAVGGDVAAADSVAVVSVAVGSVGERLREEGRVALNDGPTFGTGLESFARLNFATSRPILTRVIDRIEAWVKR